jgi:magnesium-protoporphyrin IX monomethyl ester (oxidative) cyclase
MKILLIKPPYNVEYKTFNPSLPLGLCYIAAVLEKNNYEVKIIDCVIEDYKNIEHIGGDIFRVGLSWNNLKKKIKMLNPDIVGISCSFTIQSFNAFKVAEIAKKVNPDLKVVMGGIHPSSLPKEVLRNKNVDYVIIGEGEYSFLELVRKLEKGKSPSSIDGLGFKSDKHIKINPKTKFIKNIDELPFPARHLLPVKEYFKAGGRAFHIKSKKNMSIITSRGCPFNCKFCSIHCLWGYNWRPHSPERVINEIKYLIDAYDVEEISFEDDNMILDRRRFIKICEGIAPFGIKWCTPNGIRADALDFELLKIMKNSGCYSLNLAIEHGDLHILNEVMNKKLDLKRVRKTVNYCKRLGIHTFGYFVIGMPGETKKTINKAIEFAKSLPLDEIGVSIATPYPGSRLYEECLEKGYVKNLDFSKLFVDRAVISTPQLSAKELEELRVKFSIEFNKRRINILPYIRRVIKNPMLLSRYIKMIINEYKK